MLFSKIFENYRSMVWAPENDYWSNLLRIASVEILSSQRLNEFHEIRADEGKLLIKKLCSKSGPVDMKLVFYELTFNVMMRMISGKRYFGGDTPDVEEEGKRFRRIIDEACLLAGASNLGDYLPILSWFGATGLEKKIIALKKEKDVFFLVLIDQLKKREVREVTNKKTTMVEVLLSLQESDPENYDDELIKSFVLVR
ncbi:hypothetical protein L1987_23073 [Smallanthus sonchifolius]|uniref:Uncharacterized protein n=1 Tax=Smallanthus sonchifolius TaxID=185202 RepID=A0ACB9IGN0_9ASTR|nr:hypothetical protein L1987_23073 [Smallanthus sonchifolius]